MRHPPVIVVQLVHIFGPEKGRIQEFAQETIRIGRHPTCDVRFPPDMKILSRMHAEIVREGNQFRLVDKSTNGTFVNGKRVQEAFLKNGDVITFAEGGPKVSFLAELRDTPPASVAAAPPPPPAVEREPEAASTPPPSSAPPPPRRAAAPPPPVEPPRVAKPPAPEPARPAPTPPREERLAHPVQPAKTKVPVIIQVGPTLRSFKEVPVTLGAGSKCDVVLSSPGIQEVHAQIFFAQGAYWVKDLTGLGVVTVGGKPAGAQAPLAPEDELSLGPRGPVFRFMGEGRFAEVAFVAPPPSFSPPGPKPPQAAPAAGGDQGEKKSVLKKFFR